MTASWWVVIAVAAYFGVMYLFFSIRQGQLDAEWQDLEDTFYKHKPHGCFRCDVEQHGGAPQACERHGWKHRCGKRATE